MIDIAAVQFVLIRWYYAVSTHRRHRCRFKQALYLHMTVVISGGVRSGQQLQTLTAARRREISEENGYYCGLGVANPIEIAGGR